MLTMSLRKRMMSEEEDIREWIDGDFILGDRFFARSAYEEMDPTRAPAPGLRCVHSNRYGS